MKKIISIIASFVMAFACLIPVYAEEDYIQYPTVEELLVSGDLDLRDVNVATPLSLSDTVAANISIYCNMDKSSSSSPLTTGHSFLVIKNFSQTRTYGTYSVKAGKSFSIGTFGNKGYNGIWYNVESNDRSDYTGSKTFYLKSIITGDKMTAFRNKLKTMNNWLANKNCAYFAVTMWNQAGCSKITPTVVETPSTLKSKIQKKSGSKTGKNDSDFANAIRGKNTACHY